MTSVPTSQGRGTHGDVFVGLGLLLFCAGAYGSTTTFRSVPAALSQNVPPTFFPRLVLGAIAALSLLLVLRGIGRAPEPREKVSARVPVTGILLVLAVVLVAPLGMLATVGLVALVLPYYWGERRPARLAALALGLPLAIHGIFAVAFGLRFPRGFLGF